MEEKEKVEQQVEFDVENEEVEVKPEDIEIEVEDVPLDKPRKLQKENKKLNKENNDLKNQVEALVKENEEMKKELEVTKNAYYKAYADTDNLKKRLQAEADKANKYRIQSFASEILTAIDALELALAGKDTEDSFVKGVKLTYDKIMYALANEGVTQVECKDKPFDANVANAIMTEKVDGVEPNMVVEVLQKGYMLKDRLLRAALVKVSE